MQEKEQSNPVAVGDQVLVEVQTEIDQAGRLGEGVVVERMPRKNFIARRMVGRRDQAHVLGANIDQVVVLATLRHPPTSTGFMDRVFVTAESFRIPQGLVFNKMDLLSVDEQETVRELCDRYTRIGVGVFTLSLEQGDPLDGVLDFLYGKTTVLIGLSGVGKSTLLNRLVPHAQQTIGEVSSFSQKGVHTTTYAERFSINSTTHLIDSPGLREWGMIGFTKEEMSDYFPEMRELHSACHFGARCLHRNEPGCAVRSSVATGVVAADRYHNYLSLIAERDTRQ